MAFISLAAVAAFSLVSHFFGITDALVAANCGAAPTRSYDAIDAYIAFLDCERTVEQRYWTVVALLLGCAIGYGARAWLRREAKRDTKTDEQLQEEIALIRADAEHRPRA